MPKHVPVHKGELELITEVVDEGVWDYFDIQDDPFSFVIPDTEEVKSCKKAIAQAQKRGRMLGLVGDVGAGKTTLLDLLKKDPGIKLINPCLGHQRELSPPTLRREMIRALRYDNAYGKISSHPELQMHELGELLHRHRQAGETVILALDDGQQFRLDTLKILKRIREVSYWGRRRLVEVIVLTHTSGQLRLQRIEEVAKRFTFKRMVGFTRDEVRSYAERAMGQHFASPAVIDDFADKVPDRRPLTVQVQLLLTLQRVMVRGGRLIESQDIQTPGDLRALVKSHGITLKTIADQAGVSVPTVSQILSNRYGHGKPQTRTRVREVVSKLLEQRRGPSGGSSAVAAGGES